MNYRILGNLSINTTQSTSQQNGTSEKIDQGVKQESHNPSEETSSTMSQVGQNLIPRDQFNYGNQAWNTYLYNMQFLNSDYLPNSTHIPQQQSSQHQNRINNSTRRSEPDQIRQSQTQQEPLPHP